jgi:membrane protein implicated in regulation of membrane protease activity
MPTIFWLWLAAGVIFLIIEIITPTLVFACFVAGSAGAAVSSTMTDSYLIQAAVFALISMILIPLTRPLAKRITKPSPQATNIDAVIGRPGVVIKKIDSARDVGQVRVDGQVWQAVAGEVIDEGESIHVDEVKGARLYVSRRPAGK